jgi:hypothetical protein
VDAQNTLIVHPGQRGGWCFARVEGTAVDTYGPFITLKLLKKVTGLAFPGMALVYFLHRCGPENDEMLLDFLNRPRLGATG